MKTITETNRQLINAIVAEGMNKLPAGVIEKDFLVTEVLQKLAGISIAEMDIVFCGGTCLSKAHSLIERMSEDLDFKVRLFEEVSRSARIRRNLMSNECSDPLSPTVSASKNTQIGYHQ